MGERTYLGMERRDFIKTGLITATAPAFILAEIEKVKRSRKPMVSPPSIPMPATIGKPSKMIGVPKVCCLSSYLGNGG